MTIYSVSCTSRYYRVIVEWEAWAVPTDRDLRIFAAGAASLREGGPVGEAAVNARDEVLQAARLPGRAEVWVNCLDPEGGRF